MLEASILAGVMLLMACSIGTPLSPTRDQQTCLESEVCGTAGPQDVAELLPITAMATPAPGSRYYHVSNRGSDSNPGTKDLPLQSISSAAEVAKAGDVVLIEGGTYYEDIKPLYSGEPDKYITYQRLGDEPVIIDAEDGKRAAGIEIDNKNYLHFIGITVRGANSYSTWPRAGISITDGAHHIILSDMTVYDNYVGIMAHGREEPVRFITVRNSRTFGTGNLGNIHYGIFFYRKVYDSSIMDNHVAYTLPETQSYGIEIATDYPGIQSDGPRRILVAGNEIDHNESQGIHTWNAGGVWIDNNYLHDNGATGIQIEDGSEDIVIENNLSENNAQTYEFEAGAWIDDSKNVLVRNNVFRSNKIGLTITGSDRVIVHDNYLYLNNRGAENLVNAAGLIVEDSAANISVTQNTFYRNGVQGMQHGAVNFGLFNPFCSSITFKNNIVAETANAHDLLYDSCSSFASDYNNFSNGRPLAMKWNELEMDWQTYQAVSGQDAHSLTSIPLFTDPAAFDFSLLPASPLIGKGTILARTTDAGSGTLVSVTDASYFSDGFGVGRGDSLVIGDDRVRVVMVDYVNDVIGLDQAIGWDKNEPVSFPYSGTAPDMGATNHQ